MNGVSLSARYGFPPNSLGYCGKGSFTEALRKHLEGGNDAALEAELRKFKAQFTYLSLIARENGKKPFDFDVVEAFWIGNELLDSISHGSLRSFILKDLFPPGNARASKLARSLPEGAVPHHSFNSLYIRFLSDSVERSVQNLDSCCITWGKVISVSKDKVSMMRNSISSDGKRFVIRPVESVVVLEKNGIRFLDGVSKGDVLSVHWGMAIEKLSEERVARLEKYTRINVAACDPSTNFQNFSR